MTVVQQDCPDCGERVARCDNGVVLDVPAVAYDEAPDGACWAIMQLGPLAMACVPAVVDRPDRGHVLHKHQPPEP